MQTVTIKLSSRNEIKVFLDLTHWSLHIVNGHWLKAFAPESLQTMLYSDKLIVLQNAQLVYPVYKRMAIRYAESKDLNKTTIGIELGTAAALWWQRDSYPFDPADKYSPVVAAKIFNTIDQQLKSIVK